MRHSLVTLQHICCIPQSLSKYTTCLTDTSLVKPLGAPTTTKDTVGINAKRCCGAACTCQRRLLCTQPMSPTTASRAQFCLLCCQPVPVPGSLTARLPQLAPWEPCRLLAWSGDKHPHALQVMPRSTALLHPATTPSDLFGTDEKQVATLPRGKNWSSPTSIHFFPHRPKFGHISRKCAACSRSHEMYIFMRQSSRRAQVAEENM